MVPAHWWPAIEPRLGSSSVPRGAPSTLLLQNLRGLREASSPKEIGDPSVTRALQDAPILVQFDVPETFPASEQRSTLLRRQPCRQPLGRRAHLTTSGRRWSLRLPRCLLCPYCPTASAPCWSKPDLLQRGEPHHFPPLSEAV